MLIKTVDVAAANTVKAVTDTNNPKTGERNTVAGILIISFISVGAVIVINKKRKLKAINN